MTVFQYSQVDFLQENLRDLVATFLIIYSLCQKENKLLLILSLPPVAAGVVLVLLNPPCPFDPIFGSGRTFLFARLLGYP